MAEQSNELLIENQETYLIGYVPFLEVNTSTFDLYFHDCDIDYRLGYKRKFKDTFCH